MCITLICKTAVHTAMYLKLYHSLQYVSHRAMEAVFSMLMTTRTGRILVTCVVALAWMVVSSALILLNKWIMVADQFEYPLFLSGLGMLFSSCASYICCRVWFWWAELSSAAFRDHFPCPWKVHSVRQPCTGFPLDRSPGDHRMAHLRVQNPPHGPVDGNHTSTGQCCLLVPGCFINSNAQGRLLIGFGWH